MKTFKFIKALYVATYLGIIALAVFKIASKVKGCPCDKCKRRPLFESAEKSKEADRMLTPENSGFRRKELNIFVGEPNIGKKMLEMAETAGKIPEEGSKEVTLERHHELDSVLKGFARMEEAKREAEGFLDG
jgi:hypothetical protein